MKILGWNCRGMLSNTAVRELLDLQKRTRADLIFLSESHLNNCKADELRHNLGFDSMFVVESDGKARGLTLFYHKSNKVELNYVSPHFIDIVFMYENVVQWRFTGFYGHPKWNERHLSWDDIRNLHSKSNHPWVVLGDFNEILYPSKKEGGVARPLGMMREFRECLMDCGLEDLGYNGDMFTWRRGEIRERLDRAVCNLAWANKFPRAAVINEEHVHSDHRPIVLDTDYLDEKNL